jgi:radical SAM superfamily enzyme YgiQ (UPF0313 family)
VKRLWLDLGDLGAFVQPAGPLERWQDHGLGLLRTIQARAGIASALCSVRSLRGWHELAPIAAGYDLLMMNVRSYTFPLAREAARIFKRARPGGVVVTGGMHASVALAEMEAVEEFDHIVTGAGEGLAVPLASDPSAFPRVVPGVAARSMDDWPAIDRVLWPNPRLPDDPWPLEPSCGWGPAPVATVLTSRVCPWQCAFCNEASFIANLERRSPEVVIDELNDLDERFGPLGSVVIHDSMFFQQPPWLERWLDLYPRRARQCWPYWAAARADTVRRWPDLFESLVRETNWHTISIGFESGSERMLRVLNKECTPEDNYFTVDLLNRIGGEYVRRGKAPPEFWANIMFGIPGETREDAFDTMRLAREMRYRQLSVSYYSPYPGSVLGYQLAAEGRSLLTADTYHRYPQDEKVRGVDYAFYRDLLAGRFDEETNRRPRPESPVPGYAAASAPASSRIYLFELRDGRQKLAYGATPAEAVASLRLRLPAADVDDVDPDRCRVVAQRDLQQHIDRLG